jgi:cupin 2 domain-containing protein
MNISGFFEDIKSPYLLYFKGCLFGLTAVVSGLLLLLFPYHFWYRLGLLVICVWSSCRFYYFFFYVLDHYVGGNKNSGIVSMVSKLFRQHRTNNSVQVEIPPITNLLMGLPDWLPEERIENLVVSKNIRIERIISTGHASSPDFWYDQAQAEWITILQGDAVLEFETDILQQLSLGDSLLIPPHCKHRIISTSSTKPTVWLTVFFNDTKTD